VKLSQLEPQFLKITSPSRYSLHDDIASADGIEFLCPVCFEKNFGRIGTHMVLCWQPHVPQTVKPGPGRWNFEGTGYADLTLVAGSSSVQLMGGCNAHFWVRGGEIVLA
jgi:hypothetical protein